MIPIIDSILGIANKFVVDKDKQLELRAEIVKGYESGLKAAVEADKDIKIAEMRQGGIASVWRPIAALSIFATIFLHWFVIPLANYIMVTFNYEDLGVYHKLDPLPVEFYGLATAFVSIYAYGRSREKEAFNLRVGK